MSGTSLDGLDIAYASFDFSNNDDVQFELLKYKTFELPIALVDALIEVQNLKPEQIFQLDQEMARFFSQCVEKFIVEFQIDKNDISAIASHGQTIFHRPQNGYTTQIGSGSTLNFLTKIPVIDQFRQLDIAAGGQGAPLVPLGDRVLFSKFGDGFLNLGGFANISASLSAQTIAFDIGPCNLPMNIWMRKIGKDYDQDGHLSRTGFVNKEVLGNVLSLPYFKKNNPKSLGTEWLHREYLPYFEKLSLPDRLRTHFEVLKTICIEEFENMSLKNIFITGGGAYNKFFVQLLEKDFKGKLIRPDQEIIDFKEALIFAFLGARFLRNETTTLKEVTGAKIDLRTGVLHDFMSSLQ